MLAVDTRRISIDQDTDVVSGIYVMSSCIPAVMPMLAAALQAASEVAQTRHRGDCSVNLLLPVDRSIDSLDDDAPEVLSSGREPAGESSEVGSDVCVVQDLLPTAVSVRTVVAEMWMERFVLVPEAYPVVSMTVARTFGPALSEEYSPVVLAGGMGGGVAAAYPLIVVESDTARVSVLPMVESDTARVSVLPVAGRFFGEGRLGCGWSGRWPAVSLSGFGGILPALIDERAEMNYTVPGVTPDSGPLEGTPVLEPLEHSGLEMSSHDKHMVEAPVLEPLEHSVLEKPLDGGSLEGRPVVDWFVRLIMEPLEHSVLATAEVWEPLEHSNCVVTDHVDIDYFWMAPGDAGGTIGDSYRSCVTFCWTVFRSVVRLSCRSVFVDMDCARLFRSLGRYVCSICMGDTRMHPRGDREVTPG